MAAALVGASHLYINLCQWVELTSRQEADDACLASLSDALADGLDRMMESSKVLDRTGEIESVREGVVRLHVTVLKFWACAARRIEDDKLGKCSSLSASRMVLTVVRQRS